MRKMRTPAKGIILFFFFLAILVPQISVGVEERKEVALDFDDVDIKLFIRVISELTGKNFIIDNNVKGKITVLSPKKLTTEQAYEVFKSVLAVNGFTVVQSGEVTKIIPAANMSGYELPLSARRLLKGEDQFITQIMPLKYLDANGLQPLVKHLLSRQATIFATPSSDLLIITDYKSNIRKIDKLLDEIDIDISDLTVKRLDLKYSPANTVSSKITEILEAKHGKARQGTRAVFFKIVPLDRTNAVIAVASSDIMTEIRGILEKIDHPTPEGKSLLNVYYLENADAEDMVSILTQTQKAMAGATEGETVAIPQQTEAGGIVTGGKIKGMGEDISITADKSTNSLIIYAKPDDYSSIKEMIKKLDIPRKQVFIEALIMEVSPDEQFNFGTEWEGFKDVGHPISSGSRAGVISGSKNSGALDSTLVEGAVSLGSGFSLGLLGERITVGGFTFPSLSVLIRAVETLKTTEILSRPQLLVLNNEKANINISDNIPFQTTETILEGGGTSQNIDYRDVGIILDITPHINKAGKVRLEISQEVSTVSGGGSTPATRKRAINTVVEVNNGSTVIIGGLIQEQQDFSKGAMPCLGGLPFMGWAFKSISVTDSRKNLLVFISPRVIETAKDIETLSIEKREYMENEKKRNRELMESEKPFFMENAPKSTKQP